MALTQEEAKLVQGWKGRFPDPTKLFKSNSDRAPASPPTTLSKTQKKYLGRQLRRFGYSSLSVYLLSEDWREVKERYRATVHLTGEDTGYWKRGLPQTCVVCKDPNVDLHHRTYARLGEELLTDIAPLCRLHHDQLHDEGLDLWHGPSILRKREASRGRQTLSQSAAQLRRPNKMPTVRRSDPSRSASSSLPLSERTQKALGRRSAVPA